MTKNYVFILLVVLSFTFWKKGEGQVNLVPNGDFEMYNICPPNTLPSGWYINGSVDYYNGCDTTNFASVPKNRNGHQYAKSGNGYIGLIGYSPLGFDREYIGIQLSGTLVSGQIYYVNFYVSLGDTLLYGIKNMGALFTYIPYGGQGSTVSIIPQIENAGGVLTDKNNWVGVSGSFIADGGEKYVTIGNFRDDANTVSQYVGNGGQAPNYSEAYYYIDDVYVGETPLSVSDELIVINDELRVFPNPAKEIINVTFKNKNVVATDVEITNVIGQLQATVVEIKNNVTSINIAAMPSGIYFVKVFNKLNGVVMVGKFVKE
jgi:OOP family OmpA-OmpF porin